MTRIRLSIDRIVADGPAIDRQALEQALRAELARMLAAGGAGALGAAGSLPVLRATLARSAAPLPARIAATTLRAVAERSVAP